MCNIADTIMAFSVAFVLLGLLGWGYCWYLIIRGLRGRSHREIAIAMIVPFGLVLVGYWLGASVGKWCI